MRRSLSALKYIALPNDRIHYISTINTQLATPKLHHEFPLIILIIIVRLQRRRRLYSSGSRFSKNAQSSHFPLLVALYACIFITFAYLFILLKRFWEALRKKEVMGSWSQRSITEMHQQLQGCSTGMIHKHQFVGPQSTRVLPGVPEQDNCSTNTMPRESPEADLIYQLEHLNKDPDS